MRFFLIFLMILVSLFCFAQKDSSLIRDRFFLEINGGIGCFKYKMLSSSNNSTFYSDQRDLSIILSIPFYYRYKRFKFGMGGGAIYINETSINPYFNGEIALNLIFNRINLHHFFGPSCSYSFFYQYPGFNVGKYAIGTGFDYHFKHLHVGLKYLWFGNESSKYVIDGRNIFINFGYAFNLESFRKKK